MNRKDPLPEWKLSQYNVDPLHWHEWFGQFVSAVDSARMSDDVKLTYLKTLVTGKAKNAIAEFAYSGVMYKDALNLGSDTMNVSELKKIHPHLAPVPSLVLQCKCRV